MARAEDDDLLLSAEVAQRLRITEGALRIWRHRKQGPPFYRYGRRVVYRASEVDAWLLQQRGA